jgi:hypothetical protein
MNRRACYIGFLFALAVIAAALAPIVTLANELTFKRGQQLEHMLSVCLTREDAEDVMKAEVKGGYEAAELIWKIKEQEKACGNVPVIGPKVGKVVSTFKVKREGKTIVSRVVEILIAGKVEGFLITTAHVAERNA